MQRLVQLRQSHAHRLGLGAVDVDVELRHVRAEAGDQRNQARFLLRGGEQFLGCGFQRWQARIVQVLHLNLEPPSIAQTTNRRWRQHQHARLLNTREGLADVRQQRITTQLCIFAIIERV